MIPLQMSDFRCDSVPLLHESFQFVNCFPFEQILSVFTIFLTRPGTTLVVGDFGLCTQALVNLCTIGQALPGLDDEVMERYDGEIEIGMLTFEEVRLTEGTVTEMRIHCVMEYLDELLY